MYTRSATAKPIKQAQRPEPLAKTIIAIQNQPHGKSDPFAHDCHYTLRKLPVDSLDYFTSAQFTIITPKWWAATTIGLFRDRMFVQMFQKMF